MITLLEPPTDTHEKYLKWNDELVRLMEPEPTEVLPAKDGAESPSRCWYGKDGKWKPCYILENSAEWLLQGLLIEYSELKFVYSGMPYRLIVHPDYPQRSFTVTSYSVYGLLIEAYLEYRRRNIKERAEYAEKYQSKHKKTG